MSLKISDSVRAKLAERQIVEAEINECLLNREKDPLIDNREENKTNPPTQWFIAETDMSRRLKIVFIREKSGDITLKTAYEPDDNEEGIYERS